MAAQEEQTGAGAKDAAQALELKNEGNDALARGKYGEATTLYSRAIDLDATSHVLYSNRAMAHIKAESYGLAIADAEQAIRLDATYIKAYYRRGSANFALGKYKLALRDFKAVCKLRPTDRDARLKLKACQKAAKQLAFQSAIESDDAAPLSDSLDVSTIKVDESYDGPRLPEDGVPTDEFIDAMLERFRSQKLIHKKYVLQILLQAKKLLEEEKSMVDLKLGERDHITVCGDVHGQFYDLLHIFEINGRPSSSNPYVFNGDLVDRGSFSFEVALSLFALKVQHPNGVHINRGNHETKNMSKIYGFEGEVRHKFDNTVLALFHECFQWLPLAACIESKVFCVHGGLSSDDGVTLDDVRTVARNREPPDSGLMCDLLWSDPQAQGGRSPSKRGVGLSFGPDVTRSFLATNDLDLVIRSHEVRDNGYEVEHGGALITVFSAPNYCDAMGNKGAFIHLDSGLVPKFTTYDAVPHPPLRPMAYASASPFGL